MYFPNTSFFQYPLSEFLGNMSLDKCREYFFTSQFLDSVTPQDGDTGKNGNKMIKQWFRPKKARSQQISLAK